MTVHVTDHAVLRYLERVIGIDVEQHRSDLCELAGPAVRLKAKHAMLSVGCCVVIEGDFVITVLPDMPKTSGKAKNDRGGANGTSAERTKIPWQVRKRKRWR